MDAHGSRYVENFSCCMYDQISRNFRSLTENAESVTHTRTHTQTDPPTYTGLLISPQSSIDWGLIISTSFPGNIASLRHTLKVIILLINSIINTIKIVHKASRSLKYLLIIRGVVKKSLFFRVK